MDLKDFLQFFISYVESRSPGSDAALWKAVAWMNVFSLYAEVSFLTVMTSMETVTSYASRTLKTEDAEDKVYKELLWHLRDCLKQFPASAIRDKVLDRLSSLGQLSFGDRIISLMRKFNLPRGCLKEADIRYVIRVRNDVVHRGRARDNEDILEAELIVRELLVQVIFSCIGYSGPYESYVGGWSIRDFAAGPPRPLCLR